MIANFARTRETRSRRKAHALGPLKTAPGHAMGQENALEKPEF